MELSADYTLEQYNKFVNSLLVVNQLYTAVAQPWITGLVMFVYARPRLSFICYFKQCRSTSVSGQMPFRMKRQNKIYLRPILLISLLQALAQLLIRLTLIKSLTNFLFIPSFVHAQNAMWSQKNAEIMNQSNDGNMC